jgi:hypothetical protein
MTRAINPANRMVFGLLNLGRPRYNPFPKTARERHRVGGVFRRHDVT